MDQRHIAGLALQAVAQDHRLITRRARYRWDSAKAVDWSVRAVSRLMEASGGRGIFLTNPIQRAWRDVHAMRAHIGNNPERAAAVLTAREVPFRREGDRLYLPVEEADAPPIIAALVTEGVPIFHARSRTATLEEMFLETTGGETVE